MFYCPSVKNILIYLTKLYHTKLKGGRGKFPLPIISYKTKRRQREIPSAAALISPPSAWIRWKFHILCLDRSKEHGWRRRRFPILNDRTPAHEWLLLWTTSVRSIGIYLFALLHLWRLTQWSIPVGIMRRIPAGKKNTCRKPHQTDSYTTHQYNHQP